MNRRRGADGSVIRRWDDLPRRIGLLAMFVVIVAASITQSSSVTASAGTVRG